MPTVHCPSCNRALHLPEAQLGVTARCPLCQATFPTPSQPPAPRPLERSSASAVPARPWRAREQEIPSFPGRRNAPDPDNDEPLELDDLSEKSGLPVKMRRALHSSARWLRWFVSLSIIQFVTCGCGNIFVLAGRMTRFEPYRHAIWFYLVPFALEIVGLVLVYLGAGAIEGRRNRGLAVSGCILAMFLSTIHLLLPCLTLVNNPRSMESDMSFFLVSIAVALVMAVVGLTGSVKGLLILSEPQVVRYFYDRR